MDEKIFNSLDRVNDTKPLDRFWLRLEDRTGDVYTSSASVGHIQPADNGTTLSCEDGEQNVKSVTFIVLGRFKHNHNLSCIVSFVLIL